MLNDVGRFWTWAGVALLLLTPGFFVNSVYMRGRVKKFTEQSQTWLLEKALAKYAGPGVTAPIKYTELPCPIADHPARAFHSPSGKFCYAIYAVQRDWEGAAEFCSQKGGNLARLDGSEEISDDVFAKMFRQMKHDCAWIGLSEQNGQWQWVDGSPLENVRELNSDMITWMFSCGARCKTRELFDMRYPLSRRTCASILDFFCEYEMSPNASAEHPDDSTKSHVASPEEPRTNGNKITIRQTGAGHSTNSTAMTPTAHQSPESTRPMGEINPMVDTGPMDGSARADDTVHVAETVPTRNAALKNDTELPVGREPKYQRRTTKKTSGGTFLKGKSMFLKSLKSVISCVWQCFKFGTSCTVINYNADIPECVGFASIGDVVREKRDNWQVWETL